MLNNNAVYEHEENTFDDKQYEQHMLKQYLPLVKRSVLSLKSHCGPMIELEDMEQIAMLALLDSIRRYPGDHDLGFLSFAKQRIRGAILDEMRRIDWRPRPVRQQAHEFNDKVRNLARQLGRTPNDREIAEHLKISSAELREMLYAVQAKSLESLDEMLSNGSSFPQEDCKISAYDKRKTLNTAIHKLNKRDQVILSLYYQHELNLKEIAATLGLTETRICQLHKAAVQQLKAIYKDWQ